MGTVTTERVLTETWYQENHGQPGSFGVLSRDSSQTIRVAVGWSGGAHQETIELVRIGDACEFDLLNVDWVRIEADTYPTTVLINDTNAAITISAAPYVTPDPANPLPVVVTNMVAKLASMGISAPVALPTAASTPVPCNTVVEAGDPAYVHADLVQGGIVIDRAGVYELTLGATIQAGVAAALVPEGVFIGDGTGGTLLFDARPFAEIVPGNAEVDIALATIARLTPTTLIKLTANNPNAAHAYAVSTVGLTVAYLGD